MLIASIAFVAIVAALIGYRVGVHNAVRQVIANRLASI